MRHHYLLLLAALLTCVGARAQTFSLPAGGGIPDVTETCFQLTVSGLPAVADTSFGLARVNFNITHTYDSDLHIRLRAPNGTVVMLVDGRGGSGDNFTNTELRMNARVAIANGQAPFTGSYRPDSTLNATNNGQNPNGTWELCVDDRAAADVGILNSFSLTFGANPPPDPAGPALPCSLTNPRGCRCADSTQVVCELLPDMTASGQIMTAQHTEVPGALSISNATPNIGWGPMEIHGSGQCFCDTVAVTCGTLCPNGEQPKERVLQRVYHKVRADSIAAYDRPAGFMSYHPSHGHVHVDNWGEFSLRLRGAGADPLAWPVVAEGAKIAFCLINLGDCSANNGYCRDSNGATITQADIPNAGFGFVTGCGRDQGIFTGHLDIYDQNLPGMTITLPSNVCNGSYWLVSTTDPNNDFLESDETNNSIAVPITLNRQMARPTPVFTYSQVGGQYAFNGAGIPAAARFRWNFHDGSPLDSVNNPTLHTFAAGGAHRVTFTVLSPCGTDSVTRTFTALGTLADLDAAHFNLRVSPNPTAGVTALHYALPSTQTATVDVYNILGERIVRTALGPQAPGEHVAIIELDDAVPTGVYMVWLRTEKGGQAVRVVKQ